MSWPKTVLALVLFTLSCSAGGSQGDSSDAVGLDRKGGEPAGEEEPGPDRDGVRAAEQDSIPVFCDADTTAATDLSPPDDGRTEDGPGPDRQPPELEPHEAWPCHEYLACLEDSPEEPTSCLALLSKNECQLCRVLAALECASALCGADDGAAQCIEGCGKHPDLEACLLNCGAGELAVCLFSYVDGGACNGLIATCGLPPAPDFCTQCVTQHRACEAGPQGLSCGDCLEGFAEAAGVCAEVEDCQGGCGPGGACVPETGACQCFPGYATVEGNPCQWVFESNQWMEVVGPTQTASFWQGSDKYSSQYGPCRPVTIAYPFSMLKYEVTRSEFRRCVENGPCTQPICSDTPGNPALDLVDEHYADHPVVCASRPMAATYCEWVGGRLPSESEWEYAAAGPNTGCHAGWWYPWSSSFVSGQYANYAEGYNPFQGAEPPDQNGGPTTPVGFFDGSLRSRAGAGWLGGPETFQTQDNSSPFGIFDLAGNVAEWAADGWHASFAPGAPQDGSAWLDETSPEGVKRGEGWPDSGKALTVFFRGPKSPTLALSFMGIRCVTDSPLGP